MSRARAGDSRLCPLVRSLLRSQVVRFLAAESFQIFLRLLSKNLAFMLLNPNEKMYQKIASLVAERLRRAEAQAKEASQKKSASVESPLLTPSSQSGSSLSRSQHKQLANLVVEEIKKGQHASQKNAPSPRTWNHFFEYLYIYIFIYLYIYIFIWKRIFLCNVKL